MSKLESAMAAVAKHLDQIADKVFLPGTKLTFLARTPGHDDADFCMTDDDMDEIAKMIERRRAGLVIAGGQTAAQAAADFERQTGGPA